MTTDDKQVTSPNTGLETAYRLIDVDDQVKVVVLSATGRMFCAGADLDIGFRGGASNAEEEFQEHRGNERDVDHRDGYVHL